MKFGKVLTYKDIKEAKKLIGKRVLASNNYMRIKQSSGVDTNLGQIREGWGYPFWDRDTGFQFIREVIEE